MAGDAARFTWRATPEQKIQAGELDEVRSLLYSILYIGIS